MEHQFGKHCITRLLEKAYCIKRAINPYLRSFSWIAIGLASGELHLSRKLSGSFN